MSKVAIITGASSGIGKSFVKALAENNFMFGKEKLDKVFIVARRKEELNNLVTSFGEVLSPVVADLTSESANYEIEKVVKDQKHEVLLLVNCAGMGKRGALMDKDAESAGKTIDLNIRSLTMLTRLIATYMAKNGRIINIASSAAFMPQVGFAVYAASKSYVVSFGTAMDFELRDRGIRTLTVCPGPVKTEFQINATDGGSGEFTGFRKLVVADPDKLAKKSLKASLSGRHMLVYGFSQKLLHLASKILPMYPVLFFEKLSMKNGDK